MNKIKNNNELHNNIYEKLTYFVNINKIPNIIFHGPSGCGKRTILNNFINMIYENKKNTIKQYVMFVNCAHGKGIKFIREELKFFAKTNIHNGIFKTIVLSNADKLTIDGQSALRRCIELFSHNTRFFIIVEDKYKLLKPILSRFCEIYIPLPTINNEQVNLNKYNSNNIILNNNNLKKEETIKTLILNILKNKINLSNTNVLETSKILYEKGYSALDLLEQIEKLDELQDERKYLILLFINKIKKEFRSEKMLIMFILTFLIRSDYNLENISVM
jgi:DNA polymerase III delta prime subunit